MRLREDVPGLLALGTTRTTDHRLGRQVYRGAINGPLVISLDHQAVSLWTPSANREAVTVHQPRSVTAFCRTCIRRCQHETIEENTLVGVAYHRPDRPRPFVAAFCRQQHARTHVIAFSESPIVPNIHCPVGCRKLVLRGFGLQRLPRGPELRLGRVEVLFFRHLKIHGRTKRAERFRQR
jgi:hypothetical protein